MLFISRHFTYFKSLTLDPDNVFGIYPMKTRILFRTQ